MRSRHRATWFSLVLALLLAGAPMLAAAGADAVDPLPIRAHLVARDFDALEAAFVAHRDAGNAASLTSLVDGFRTLTDEQQAGLDAWRTARPGSGAAWLAAASREVERAWIARGTGVASSVGANARRAVRSHARQAVEFAALAIERDAGWMDAYRAQLQASLLLGDAGVAEQAMGAAVAIDPTHYGVWRAYQVLFLQNWGGSFEAQDRVAAAAQHHATANPALRKLLGSADRDHADDLRRNGRPNRAIPLYERALTHGDDAWLRRDLARARLAAGDPAGALREADAGLRLDPYFVGLHRQRAWSCEALYDFACLDASVTRAVELDPLDPEIRQQLEWARWAAENPREARRQLDRSPLQRWLYRWGPHLYQHALTHVVLACAVGIGFYMLRRRRRRLRPERVELTTRFATPTPLPALDRRPSMVTRLPYTGVLMLRAFVWFQVLYHVLSYSEWLRPGINWTALAIDIPVSVIALVGALGFAHGIRLGAAWIWKIWTIVYPVWNMLFVLGFLGFTWAQWSIWGISHLEVFPIYMALFLYGFRCDALWAGGLPGPGWESPRRARSAAT
jgi:tetratricopeptide (TPR) repeat protein